MRFDDLSIDGSGATVKGSVELDDASDFVSANFPVFACRMATRFRSRPTAASDGVLRVAMRGDVYDGRHFVKSSLAGAVPDKAKHNSRPISISISSSASSPATTAKRCAGSI